ncbi:MAG TPA: efflux RND transporter periplasmic adaptor subunit [Planctomycetota bacterium]|nr:efflux RND transporter periplasmic adaptor subunit [Planctomycetota bacterium]
MSRAPVRSLAVSVLAILVAAGACRKEPEEKKSDRAEKKKVQVALPQRKDLERTMEVPGTVLAYYEATLYAQVAGYVKTVSYDKGDPVTRGALIAEIEVPEVAAQRGMKAAQLEQARAGLARAEVGVITAAANEDEARAAVAKAEAIATLQVSIADRARALRGSGDISVQDLEVAVGQAGAAVAEKQLAAARLEAATAEVERARVDVKVARGNVDATEAALHEVEAELAFAQVRAPFDGVVTARFVDPGVLLQRATRSENAQAVVTVTTRGRVRVDFELPEAEIAFVHSGSRIELGSQAYPGKEFEAEVTRVASALHRDSRTELCEAELANEADELLPGMYVTVKVVLEEHKQAVIAPPECVVEHEDEAYAFVVEDGRARRRAVKKGWEFGSFVELREGLSPGDQVVMGASDLEEGDAVSPQLAAWNPEPRKKPGGEKKKKGGEKAGAAKQGGEDEKDEREKKKKGFFEKLKEKLGGAS